MFTLTPPAQSLEKEGQACAAVVMCTRYDVSLHIVDDDSTFQTNQHPRTHGLRIPDHYIHHSLR